MLLLYHYNRAREQRLAEGLQLEKEGKHAEAYQKFIQAVSVSLDMVCEFLQMLIRYQIPYIIAPYESDAQMAYLSRTGIVDAVITEDSDSLCYRCPKVLFKMTAEGTSKCIQLSDVYESFGDMKNWTPELFELMCVLNGCDYADGCNRIGLKTAVKLINRGKNMKDTLKIIECNPVYKFNEFKPRLEFATACFHHQVIYNPILNKREYLTPVPEGISEKYCRNSKCHFGELKTEEIAMKRAKGFISDDQGTILLPPNTNVDYLDQFFKNIRIRNVPSLFALHCNKKKEEIIDLTEQAKNNNSSVLSKSIAVKRSASPVNEVTCTKKGEFRESPTSVVSSSIFDLSFEESITDDLLAEVDLVEKSICGNSCVCTNNLTKLTIFGIFPVILKPPS